MGKYRMKNKGSAEQSQSAVSQQPTMTSLFGISLLTGLTVLLSVTFFVRRKPTTDCSNYEASGNHLSGDEAANFAATYQLTNDTNDN